MYNPIHSSVRRALVAFGLALSVAQTQTASPQESPDATRQKNVALDDDFCDRSQLSMLLVSSVRIDRRDLNSGDYETFPNGFVNGKPGADYCIDKIRAANKRAIALTQSGAPIALDSVTFGGYLHNDKRPITVQRSAGFLFAQTASADINVYALSGDATLSTYRGSILIKLSVHDTITQFIDARAVSGNVIVEIPDGINTEIDGQAVFDQSFVDVHGRNALITSDFTLNVAETPEWDPTWGNAALKVVEGRAKLGTGGGRIVVRTRNGDITLRRAPK